jgi:hypothetical protein
MDRNDSPTPDWDKIDWDALDDDEFAELIIRKVENEPPVISDDDVEAIEKQAQLDGVTRRAAMLVLTKPGKWLIDTIDTDRGFALAHAQVHASIDDYLKRQAPLLHLMERAKARISVALAWREDMDEILREANGDKTH